MPHKVSHPVTGVSRPKPKAPREAFLRPREEAILFAACEQGPPQLPWAAKVALTTAMRASEIRRLERPHVHLDDGFVHLPKTKNGDKRDVPLVLPGAADVMAAAMQALPVRADGYLFGHPDKLGSEGGYTQPMLTASFADAIDRAALADEEFRNLNADFRFHDARHLATTRLAPLHRDALDLAKTTGHKTLSVLMRYYSEKPEDRAARLRQVARDIRELEALRAKRDRRARAKPKLKIV